MNHPGAHNQGRIVTMDMTPDIWFTVMLGTHTHTHAKKFQLHTSDLWRFAYS